MTLQVLGSVAHPGCLSRILIFIPSRIPDRIKNKKEEGKKFVALSLFFSKKFYNKNFFYFLPVTEKIFKPIYEEQKTFLPNIVTKLTEL
jgi:hypothetical protein